ncbi:MAG: glycine zipper 2TM domain-containing protein [Luteimonas sp.]|nr:glycine zipper 2TM domain-containing protein [Luteimonas sp.]
MKFRLVTTTAMMATLALAGCATTSPGYGPSSGSSAPYPSSSSSSCYDCGTVTRIETVARGGSAPNATGAVLGGIVGAVAGRKIADNQTDSEGRKNTATAAGAVAGAVAGNAIQNRVQASATYNVYVRMNDGRTVTVTQSDLGGIREGSYVSVSGGRANLR